MTASQKSASMPILSYDKCCQMHTAMVRLRFFFCHRNVLILHFCPFQNEDFFNFFIFIFFFQHTHTLPFKHFRPALKYVHSLRNDVVSQNVVLFSHLDLYYNQNDINWTCFQRHHGKWTKTKICLKIWIWSQFVVHVSISMVGKNQP